MRKITEVRYAKTIGELKKQLENVPDDYPWFGYDDGSLIINDDTDHTIYIDNTDAPL